ncbi:hypothetical protein LCGC14_0731940 [marine sediment metagenome]|uniref:Helix-turn-helix type 11 domain-containing protein n=1 Tax=marine sediment metagenome TaxID=412755 RepID=A0A0F9TGG6_9ZZZZ
MAEEIKDKIYKFLKENAGKRFSLKEISRQTKISYPSSLKWTRVLRAEKEDIKIDDHGHIKFLWIEE